MNYSRVKKVLCCACTVGLLFNLTLPVYAANPWEPPAKHVGTNNTVKINCEDSQRVVVKYNDNVSDSIGLVVAENVVSKSVEKAKLQSERGKSKKFNSKKDKIKKVNETDTYTIIVEEANIEPCQLVDVLSNHSLVEYAEIDYVASMSGVAPNDTFYAKYQAANLTAMQVQGAWQMTKGSNSIVVAVVDSGVNPNHPDLIGRVTSGYDFVNNDKNPADDNGHGTMVAGIIAANTNNSRGIAGSNWNCYVMPVKVLDNTGNGFVSNIAAGIRYAVDNGADIINLSLGTTAVSKVLEDAVNYAYDNGVMVVAATGNTASAIQYPAAFDKAIAVGSVNASKSLADYSCYGKQMDLVAVGSGITSTHTNGSTASYATGNGTSFAAPYVASLASLVLSVNDSLNPDEVLSLMTENAVDLGSAGWDQYYGHGCVSFADTLTAISAIDVNAPTITLKGKETVTLIKGDVYEDAGATANDQEDGDITNLIKVASNVNTSRVGNYTVKYTVADKANNKAEAIRNVIVKENSKPVITLRGDRVIDITVGDTYIDEGALAYDAEDGNITSDIQVYGKVNTNREGSYVLEYCVRDSKGLEADYVTRTVNVNALKQVQNKINTAPVITLKGSGSISMQLGAKYTEAGVTAYDKEDGDITSWVIVDGYVDTSKAGNYTIYYNVSDSEGLEAREVTRNVTVFEVARTTTTNTKPVMKFNGSSFMIVNFKSDFVDPGVTATDKEDGDISYDVEAVGEVDTSKAGVYKIVYNVKDSQGLAATQITRVISVNGNKVPVIKLTGANQIQIKLGSNYSEPGFSAIDTEDGDITDYVDVTGDTVNTGVAGTYRIRYDVKDHDGAGAKSMFRFVVVAP